MNSSKITSELTTLIKKQSLLYDIHKDNLMKLEMKKSKEENCKNVTERIITKMNDNEKRLVDLSNQTGVSNWLTALSITEFGLELSS